MYIVFGSCLPFSIVFRAKVMGQRQISNAHTADVTKKHVEPLPLSATFHALKQFQKPTVCGNRLQVSCRRHLLEKMFGNLERKIAQKPYYVKKLEVHLGCLRKKPRERNFQRQLKRLVFQNFTKQDSSCHLFCKNSLCREEA